MPRFTTARRSGADFHSLSVHHCLSAYLGKVHRYLPPSKQPPTTPLSRSLTVAHAGTRVDAFASLIFHERMIFTHSLHSHALTQAELNHSLVERLQASGASCHNLHVYHLLLSSMRLYSVLCYTQLPKAVQVALLYLKTIRIAFGLSQG